MNLELTGEDVTWQGMADNGSLRAGRLPRVVAVILTYNSLADLPDCLDGIRSQRGCDLKIVVVDNASKDDERAGMLAVARQKLPALNFLSALEAASGSVVGEATSFFIQNDVNGGYSAGNNIGARFALHLGADAILILNPDVRIQDPYYLQCLAFALLADDRNAVAASVIRNLAGDNENPMHELGFIEELCWPMWVALGPLGLRPPSRRGRSTNIEKVSGSCLLVRSRFLAQIGFFDEGVFLYCEEAILGAQVKRGGWKMAYVPELEARHAHRTATKGDPSRRVRTWIRSRRYFHERYTEYGVLRRCLLRLSQGLVLGLARLRSVVAARICR
jgi:GT2 family glycosyltransferase